MDPTFAVSADRTCVEIGDPIENARFELHTADPVEPTPADREPFYFPVDAAVAVETSAVRVPKLANVLVRSSDGALVADNADHADRSLAPGAYDVELSTAPMKLYLSVESKIDVRHGEASVSVAFDGPTEVRIGARSFHDRPAGTVTTTPDPAGAMWSLSRLGSALKTTSPERSFPTLRGHPPLIEVGEERTAPDGIGTSDTGIRLELPAEYEYVYPAASLAYYLGADVVPEAEPRIVTDDGFAFDLDRPPGYGETVGRVLRQTFFLDCVVRTEGYYRVDLHEREAVESHVDLDFEALYEASPSDRLEAYLSEPYDAVEEHVPDWNLTTDVMATPDNVEVLPFVANDLALIRCPESPTTASVSPTPEPVGEFFRSDPDAGRFATDGGECTVGFSPARDHTRDATGEFTRNATDALTTDAPDGRIFTPEPTETVEHAWVGDGFPVGANKATVEAYRRRVERSTPEKTSIEIHVVCNDECMQAEGVVEEFYGLRDLLRFDVSVHYELTTDELRVLLGRSADFLHYVGHVDENGMHCPDGHLDARTVDDVNVKAFVLNACRSYAQGEALVESGSYGGVVTLSEIANSVATEIGRTLARLLNCGFPLRVALSIVKDTVAPAYQYTTVGDGGLTLCQSESGSPIQLRVRRDESEFEIEYVTFPAADYEKGSLSTPFIRNSGTRYLNSGTLDTFELTEAELDAFLRREIMPVEYDGNLYWSDQISSDAF